MVTPNAWWEGPPEYVGEADETSGIDGTAYRWRLRHDGLSTEFRLVVSHTDIESGTIPPHGQNRAERAAHMVASVQDIGDGSVWSVTKAGVSDHRARLIALTHDA